VVDLALIGRHFAQLGGALPSRTSTARRVAPEKIRLRTPTFLTRSGPSNTTRSTHASFSHGTTAPGATTVPLATSHTRPANVS
jgi:hypothetical protein